MDTHAPVSSRLDAPREVGSPSTLGRKGTGVFLPPSVLACAQSSKPAARGRPRRATGSPCRRGSSSARTSLDLVSPTASSHCGSATSLASMAGGAGTAPVSPVCWGTNGLSPFAAAGAQQGAFSTPLAHTPCCSPFGSACTAPPLSPFASAADAMTQPLQAQLLDGAAAASAAGFAPQPSLSVSQAPALGVLLLGSCSSMLAPTSLPLQQWEAYPVPSSLPAVSPGLPAASAGLQMQTADSLSDALLLSQLHRQAEANLAFAGCSGRVGWGVEPPAAAMGLDAPTFVTQDLLQLQLQQQLSGMYFSSDSAPPAASLDAQFCSSAAAAALQLFEDSGDSAFAALDAVLGAQLQALLAARNEVAMRRCMSAGQHNVISASPVSAAAGGCGFF